MEYRKHLLNEHTGTVHKPRPEATNDEAVCGALRHVPREHVESIADDDVSVRHGIERCGRCFEGAGSY